jgi:hypothetical protein
MEGPYNTRARTCILAVVSMLSLCWASSARADGVSFVEGYVFNKSTGVPLRTARVSVGFPFVPAHAVQTFTDSNGFYSFELDPELGSVSIHAICETPRGPAASGRSGLVDLREGTIRRDLYIDASRRRSFSTCQTDPSQR